MYLIESHVCVRVRVRARTRVCTLHMHRAQEGNYDLPLGARKEVTLQHTEGIAEERSTATAEILDASGEN